MYVPYETKSKQIIIRERKKVGKTYIMRNNLLLTMVIEDKIESKKIKNSIYEKDR